MSIAQVHVHCIGDAIQPSHPLMPSSPSAFSLPASGTFSMSQLFASDDQNTGVSASASFLPKSIEGQFPLRQLFATPWTAACQVFQSFTIFWSLLKLMSIESVMPSNHLIPCCPFSSCPQSFLASGSFPVSWLTGTSGCQSIGASALASVLPNI